MVAQALPAIKVKMPNPLICLVVGGGVLAAVHYLVYWAIDGSPQGSYWTFFGSQEMWYYAVGMYIPFFYVGVLAGRNDWLTSVEEMSTWVRWAVRTITLGMMVTIALLVMKVYISLTLSISPTLSQL